MTNEEFRGVSVTMTVRVNDRVVAEESSWSCGYPGMDDRRAEVYAITQAFEAVPRAIAAMYHHDDHPHKAEWLMCRSLADKMFELSDCCGGFCDRASRICQARGRFYMAAADYASASGPREFRAAEQAMREAAIALGDAIACPTTSSPDAPARP